MAKIDLTSPEWCELVFQGKNKAYGAYKMRANSPKRHTWAMVIVVIIAAAYIQRVEAWINNYPREILGFETSGSLFERYVAAAA